MIATLIASHTTRNGDSVPQIAVIQMRLATPEAAAEFAAQLPKSVRARTGYVGGRPDGNEGWLDIHVNLLPTEGNERNETGIKRLRTAERKLAVLGVEIRYDNSRYSNSYQTRADFDAAIA